MLLLKAGIHYLALSFERLTKTFDHEVFDAIPLIDGHNDFPIWLRVFYQNHIQGFNSSSALSGQVDMPRLGASNLGAQFWSIYVPCPDPGTGFSAPQYYEIIHDTLQQIDLVNRLITSFPQQLIHAYSAADIKANFKTDPRKISSLMGAEGLHQIGGSASVLRLYHQLGVRYITLTHDCNNKYADAALAPIAIHNGLSAAGKDLILEMNRLGMLVDLSHTSVQTMVDALSITRSPVIFSHSNAWALCQHVRNVPDSVLFQLRKNGGVIMVSFYPEYTNCENSRLASLGDVADHIVYIGNLIGFRHVGIGSDFDGMLESSKGLEDVSKYQDLVEELIHRGVKAQEVGSIIGGNILRVLSMAERVAETMAHVLPLEDRVKPMPH